MGEAGNGALRLRFDSRLKLEFHGAKITSDAGLLAYRELDEQFGLTRSSAHTLVEIRLGKNTQHSMLALLRQGVYSRLAGYEDTNDAERLRVDPAMRRVVGGRAEEKLAASISQMGRFETEFLPTEKNLAALSSLCGVWVDRVHRRVAPSYLVLDMDSSESPTYGSQEGSAYNGYFGRACYHPLFSFNHFGDVEGASKSGNLYILSDRTDPTNKADRFTYDYRNRLIKVAHTNNYGDSPPTWSAFTRLRPPTSCSGAIPIRYAVDSRSTHSSMCMRPVFIRSEPFVFVKNSVLFVKRTHQQPGFFAPLDRIDLGASAGLWVTKRWKASTAAVEDCRGGPAAPEGIGIISASRLLARGTKPGERAGSRRPLPVFSCASRQHRAAVFFMQAASFPDSSGGRVGLIGIQTVRAKIESVPGHMSGEYSIELSDIRNASRRG